MGTQRGCRKGLAEVSIPEVSIPEVSILKGLMIICFYSLDEGESTRQKKEKAGDSKGSQRTTLVTSYGPTL